MGPIDYEKMRRKLYYDFQDITGSIWWLQNLSGKRLIKTYWYAPVVWSSQAYSSKVLYDLIRITLEFRLKHRSGNSVLSTLQQLESYKNGMDPFSGKPYRYSIKNKVLYSVGWDYKDNDGKPSNRWGRDIALPLRLSSKTFEKEPTQK